MNLWEIAEEIERTFAQAVDPETGEINEEYMAKLDALEMDRDRKIENVACFIKNLRADAAAIKAEKDALQKRQKAAESKAESLTRYLSNFLNGEKYASPRAAITWRRSTRVEFDSGKSALDIAKLAGIQIPQDTKVILCEQDKVGKDYPFSIEKLSPLLAFYTEPDWQHACEKCL